MEDKLYLDYGPIHTLVNIKTIKKLLKNQSEKKKKNNDSFDKANSCITLIRTKKGKSQHSHLAVFALIFQMEKLILCQ